MVTRHIEIKDFLSIPVKKAEFEAQETWTDIVRQTDQSKFEWKSSIYAIGGEAENV